MFAIFWSLMISLTPIRVHSNCIHTRNLTQIKGVYFGALKEDTTPRNFIESIEIYDGSQFLSLQLLYPKNETSYIVDLHATPSVRHENRDFSEIAEKYDKFFADFDKIFASRQENYESMTILEKLYSEETVKTIDAYNLTFEIEDPRYSIVKGSTAFKAFGELLFRNRTENLITKYRFDLQERLDFDFQETETTRKLDTRLIVHLENRRKPDFFIPFEYRYFQGPHALALFTDATYRIFKIFMPEEALERLRLLEEGEILPQVHMSASLEDCKPPAG